MSAPHENRETLESGLVANWAEWNHHIRETRKVHLWICVDEATNSQWDMSGLMVNEVGNIDGCRMLELLRERWIAVKAVFGRMHTPRIDPEGAWRNKGSARKTERHANCSGPSSRRGLVQASVIENTTGIVKDTMTRIAFGET